MSSSPPSSDKVMTNPLHLEMATQLGLMSHLLGIGPPLPPGIASAPSLTGRVLSLICECSRLRVSLLHAALTSLLHRGASVPAVEAAFYVRPRASVSGWASASAAGSVCAACAEPRLSDAESAKGTVVVAFLRLDESAPCYECDEGASGQSFTHEDFVVVSSSPMPEDDCGRPSSNRRVRTNPLYLSTPTVLLL
ncbi:hypothetical protein THAOC_25317 [Thalassiosira oceanica]|uniref:Uncharacterized protein n=1 Tax=Thalassiosira oceanica TaxID=159749 RepID=K0RMN1_THAOC|nr:hypothetical protein THAOC_25317 [Thalassiosira oceanica]|eukprot:EJK55003.1 hypothetical protein THAOC_25317 [Thalassiosira oceanica]